MRPAARDRILTRWNDAAAWVADQLAAVRRIEAAAGPRWTATVRKALDRPDSRPDHDQHDATRTET